MTNPINHLKRLKERQQFREDLLHILTTDQGKRFFEQFLNHCNVTNPRFHDNPQQMAFYEGKRHLAMSYLKILGQDDPQSIIDIIEKETQNG